MASPDYAAVDYTPSATANAYQTFDLYIPAFGLKPSAGWPVVIALNHSNWTTSTKAGSITSGVKQRLLDSGIAVCDATATAVDAGVTGGGLWWDPTDPGWATDDVPEHDLIWIIQKLRDLSSTYEIDPDKVGLYCTTGSSSTIAANVTFSQDAADPGAGTTQEQQSSRVQAAVLREFLGYYPAVLSSYNPVRLRDSGTPTNPAATIANATAAHRLQASPLYRLAQSQSLGTDSGGIPLYFRSTGAPGSTDYRLSAAGAPSVSNTLANDRDTWGQIIVSRFLRRDVGRVRQTILSRHSADSDLYDAEIDFNLTTGDEEELYAQRFLWNILAKKGGTAVFSIPCIGWSFSLSTTRAGTGTGADSPSFVRRQTRSGAFRSTGEAKTRAWSVNWPNATEADVTALELIATVAHGPVLPLTFSPPDEPGEVLVRIASSSFRIVNERAGQFSMALELEEVA